MFVLLSVYKEYDYEYTRVIACSKDKFKLTMKQKELENWNELVEEMKEEYHKILVPSLSALKGKLVDLDIKYPRPERPKCKYPPRTKEEHAERTKVMAAWRELDAKWLTDITAARNAITNPCYEAARNEIIARYNIPEDKTKSVGWDSYDDGNLTYKIENAEEV